MTFPTSRLSRQSQAIQDRLPAERGARKIVCHARQTAPNPFALTSSPNDAVCPIAAKRSGRPQTCNGLPTPIFSPRGEHTFANAFGFRNRVPTPLLSQEQLPTGFGRITSSVKPYWPNLPRLKLRSGCHPETIPVGSHVSYLALMRSILLRARDEWEWIDKVPKVRLFKESASRERSLTREQAGKLLDELP